MHERKNVSCLERYPYFRGVLIEGLHCIYIHISTCRVSRTNPQLPYFLLWYIHVLYVVTKMGFHLCFCVTIMCICARVCVCVSSFVSVFVCR